MLLALRSIFSSIYFNFRYLPFRQALRLPILLYKPKFKALKGRITIDGPISPGMVRLGFPSVSIYPSSGIVIENHGGEIVFRGRCFIGAGSAISIGEKGCLDIGPRLMANAAAKFVVYHRVTLGTDCRLAWENIVMDTDLHALTKPDGSLSRGFGAISIGTNCWLGMGCLVLKNTRLPAYTTVQARTVLSREYDIPERCVIGSSAEVIVKATDTFRDLQNDSISYS